MANRYIAAMLPTLPGPVEGLVPEARDEYLAALDALAAMPGPLGEAAREEAERMRPVVEELRRRPALERVPPRPRDAR